MVNYGRYQQEDDDVFGSGSQFGDENNDRRPLSPHLPNCPTPNLRLDQCRTCWPQSSPRTSYPSPGQHIPVPHPAQEQLQRVPTYNQALHTPPSAPYPQYADFANEQRPWFSAQPNQACGSPRQGGGPAGPAVREPQWRPPPGPYSYANVAQQACVQHPASAQVQTPPSRGLYHGQPASRQQEAWPPLTPPRSAQSGPESLAEAQRRFWQRAVTQEQRLRQQQPLPQTPQQAPQYPVTPVPTDHREAQVLQNPTDVDIWNQQPRTGIDRMNAIAEPHIPLSPTVSMSLPIAMARQVSGQSGTRRNRTQMSEPSEEFSYGCDVCNKWFRRGSDRDKHKQRTHSIMATRPHACPRDGCHWRFNHPREVHRHLASSVHNSSSSTRFSCRYSNCSDQPGGFPRKDNRDRHERDKHGVCLSEPMSRSSSSRTFQ